MIRPSVGGIPAISVTMDTSIAREVTTSTSEGDPQHPRSQAEKQQHRGQHQGDIATGARFSFGRGLGDAKGVDEGIDKEA